MRVILEYDAATGILKDSTGVQICIFYALQSFKDDLGESNKALEAVAMKLAGVQDSVIDKIL